MKIFGYIILAIIAIPVLYLGSGFAYETWHTYWHRYRITIEVETPEGVKSGASVIEVRVTEKAGWLPQGSGVHTGVGGEAVFVDLGNGKNVIATLGFGPTGQEHKLEYLASLALNRSEEGWYRGIRNLKGRAELTGPLIPTLVTFADLANPSTLEIVKPGDFEKTFGPGYRFRGAWLEMTEDNVTTGIKEKLPWVGDYKAESIAELRLTAANKGLGTSLMPGLKFRRGR